MKKILILLFSALIPLCATFQAGAQNLQVLYDAEQNCVTSTIEMFRPDSFGNTYFFVDKGFHILPAFGAKWTF